jgi:hypothetical protein
MILHVDQTADATEKTASSQSVAVADIKVGQKPLNVS